jgi:hypothetical protein
MNRKNPAHDYNADVCIELKSPYLVWNHESLQPHDRVVITPTYSCRHTRPHYLFSILSHPDSNLEQLFEVAESVTLCVSYNILEDLVSDDYDGIGAACIEVLQKFHNLWVYVDDSDLHMWEAEDYKVYADVVKTFQNISDYDCSWNDKYAWWVINMIETAHDVYGVTTDRCVRIHGSDDWAEHGSWSAKHKYLQVAQEGLFDHGNWATFASDPEYPADIVTYMRFRHMNACDFAESANYPNLFSLEAYIHGAGSEFKVPAMPNLRILALEFDVPTPQKIIIEGCRNLKDFIVYTDDKYVVEYA